MVVVPATLALGLGLGILIGAELPTGHPADWTSGWQWAQQHWSTYLADNNNLSASSAAHWCNGADHHRTALRASSGPEGITYTNHEVAPSWDWQQGCIARIRSAAGAS